jgi:hypothetical protein
MTHEQLTQEALDLFDTFKHPGFVTQMEFQRIVIEYLKLQGHTVNQRLSWQQMKNREKSKV